ncbi:DnaJ domain-containing protein [Coniochaeta sp. 2T2.1]|nr:DnaJ domain-containing protein [Coniochaeta sp. 2T2.1]
MKPDMSRDYYADLELPRTADIIEVKKQFRKLALIYHPDRNPGRETEVNSKFQTIQSAHEILTNPEAKAKYDAHRKSTGSRYPTASGVRGNPWSDAGSNFPPPPRRPPMPTRPSAASRYTSWQTPPAPQRSPREDPNAAARAWDRMRPGSNRQSHHATSTSQSTSNTGSRRTPTRPMDPPPPPPRSEAQKKKADASFGTRRTNFTNSTQDERPASSSSYTTRRTNVFSQAAEAAKQAETGSDYIDPLSKQFQETFVDGRQRTPYSTHTGEKFNPFDGTNLNRGRSVRDNLRYGSVSGNSSQPTSPPSRRRSASVPDESDPVRSPGRSRADHKYTPTKNAGVNPGADPVNQNNPHTADTSTKTSNGPTVYERPPLSSQRVPQQSKFGFSCGHLGLGYRSKTYHPKKFAEAESMRPQNRGLSQDVHGLLTSVYPSGSPQASAPYNESVEAKQARQLHELLNMKKRSHDFAKSSPDSSSGNQSPAKKHADGSAPYSFGMTVDDDTFTPTTEQQRFMRKSADSINTRFVADNFSANDWQFNAPRGDEDAFIAAKKRAQRATRRGTQSPRKDVPPSMTQESGPDPQLNGQQQTESGFDAAQWTEKIGPEAFVPRPPPRNASSSPTKLNRPIKKAKPVRMTAGTAGLVDEDESSSSEDKTRPGTAMGSADNTAPSAADSPVAMDIDTPPPELEKKTNEPKVARNIPVEPSKPEWRAGVAAVGEAEAKTSPDPNRMGSEDTSAFLFTDMKNAFAPQSSGLGSLGDLKSTLPFESKAAPTLNLGEVATKTSVPVPPCPKSPRPPPVLAVSTLKPSQDSWAKYVHEFHQYMEDFADWNASVTNHFVARKNIIDESKRQTGFNWVEVRGDAGLRKYLQWCEEDKIVRQKWMAACEAHEMRVREFLKYREKMLQ